MELPKLPRLTLPMRKGDKFNLYKGATKTFTIPRMPIVRSQCPKCETTNPDYAVYCKNCGTKL